MKKTFILFVLFGLIFQPGLGTLQRGAAHVNPPNELTIPIMQVASEIAFAGQADTADSIAPSPVTSLEASTGATPGSVELRWIAPGDDYSTGAASAYVVRYNTVPIVVDEDENTWVTSTDVEGEPLPNPAGSLESMTVTGLDLGRKYYFALKSEDEMSNASAVSNLAQATALDPNPVYLPVALSTYVDTITDTVVIPDTTVVVPISTTQHLEKISGEGTFTFSQWTPELEALDPGDVMVGDVSPAAPDGFLRKVKSVDELCDKIVVTTELATLEEAIQTASIHASQALTPDRVMGVQSVEGVSVGASPDGLGFELTLEDVVLADLDKDLRTKKDQIKANGKITLDLGADVGIDISWFEVKKFHFIVDTTESAELSVNWGVSKAITSTVLLSQVRFSPFTIMAGPVPVVILPEIGLYYDLSGEVGVAVTAGVGQEARIRLGATYENGTWSGVHDFSNKFVFNSPAIELSGKVMAAFNPEATLKLYGVAGPYVGVSPYLKLEAVLTIPIIPAGQQVAPSPAGKLAAQTSGASPDDLKISLYAGLKLKSGAKVEVLGKKLANFEGASLNFQVLLLQFTFFDNREPDAPSDPLPADNLTGLPLNPLLRWTGGDPDGDDVTYDLYLEANESYPDVKVYSAGTEAFFDPGTLAANTIYYWRVVATDDEGAANYGPVWSFTTGALANTPPNEPALPSPGDGSTDTLIYLDLSWTGGDPDGDTVTYDVYLDTVNPPGKRLATDITETSVYTGGLQLSTPYFWKVVAQDEHGRATSGDVWSFTTGNSTNRPPTEPVNFNDGAIRVPLIANVSWSIPPETIPDPDEDPVTYTVHLAKEDSTPEEPLCVLQAGFENNFSCETGLLDGNASYYWQVVARDNEGATTTGPVWMFTTADMIYVPAGEFQMGCDVCNPDETCSPDEQPLHTVYLDEFTINRTEVTNSQYRAELWPVDYSRTREYYFHNPLYADYPVLYVDNWWAGDYCRQEFGGKLPTEAQWEKAARAASGTPKYPWGNASPDCSLANFSPDGGSACVGDTSQVGSYPLGASPYGVMDMSGNVKEWVRDVYSSTYYSSSPYMNPEGPPEGDTFVIRGGSWEDDDYGIRLARREFAYIEETNDTLGFRCVWQPSLGASAIEVWQTEP